MILLALFALLAAAGLALQHRATAGARPLLRGLHLAVAAALWAALLPPLLNLEKTRRLAAGEAGERGLVLADVSASMQDPAVAGKLLDLKRRLEREAGEVRWVEFADGALPPAGAGSRGRGTDLARALADLGPQLRADPPDWLWLVTDGGFPPPAALPPELRGVALRLTELAAPVPEGDRGVSAVRTDPVWYTRTRAPVRAEVFRARAGGPEEVDVLCLVDGVLAGTAKAAFAEGATTAAVDFEASAPHLGTARLEVAIAEGQGGPLADNDRLTRACQVIRDKVRVLRVVGRPTWDSKFLRDMLKRREDVDLVDFHILRGLADQPQARPEDLALIPFPVEELFVENIRSFDLIVWQDFNSNAYPFFPPSCLENVEEFVREGGGLLAVAGRTRWNHDTGVFAGLLPQRGAGAVSERVREPLALPSPGHRLFTDRLRERLPALPPLPLDIFPGRLAADAQVLLEAGGRPLLALRGHGRGRVASVATDGLWQLAYGGGAGGDGLYAELLGRVLLWLQRHPDLVDPGFTLPDDMPAGGRVAVSLAGGAAGRLAWRRVGEEAAQEAALAPGTTVVDAPSRPGTYAVRLAGGRDEVLVSVRALEGEYADPAARREALLALERLGFEARPLAAPAAADAAGAPRSTGVPWHSSWAWLAAVLALLFIHWLLVSSPPHHHQRP